MAGRIRNAFMSFAAIAIAVLGAAPVGAQQGNAQATFDTSASNLLVVLRESAGENKQDEKLTPYGRIIGEMPDGRRVEFAMSWYHYIGDMHIRLVFDGGQQLQSALPSDLERLKLTPEDALEVALTNLRRKHGLPQSAPWSGGLMQVQGPGSPDFASSYFLDREFWTQLQRAHPQGIVAAVPKRGGLVYAPADDENAITALRFSAAAMHASGDGTRLSSALYLFKDGHWSVFQAPQSHIVPVAASQ